MTLLKPFELWPKCHRARNSVCAMRSGGGYGTLSRTEVVNQFAASDRLDILDDPKTVDLDGIPKLSFFKEQLANAAASAQRPVTQGPTDLDKGFVLSASTLLTVAVSVMATSLIPLFESLRNRMGFSSFQIVALNCSSLFFAALWAGPVSAGLNSSKLWDVMGWSALSLALGTWVSTCASWGSPLEYLLLGQLFVGLSTAMLVGVPSKLSLYWIPGEWMWSGEMLWALATFTGMTLPFLVSPTLAGGTGHGKDMPTFLIWRAVLGTGVAALILAMRAGVMRSPAEERGEDDEEVELYKRSDGYDGFWHTAYEVVTSPPLMLAVVALSLTMGVVLSFYVVVPLLLSLPPHNLTPVQAGWTLWPMGFGGVLGLVAVRSSSLFGLSSERRYRPVLLGSIAGCAACLLLWVLALERTGLWALSLMATLLVAFASPLPVALHNIVSDNNTHRGSHLRTAAAACVGGLLIALVPVLSVCATHPFVVEYPTDKDSPTGFLLSAGCIFWLLLLAVSWTAVWLGYQDDEGRLVVDSNPQLIQHVTDRVASDLNEARALSEAVIPDERGQKGRFRDADWEDPYIRSGPRRT